MAKDVVKRRRLAFKQTVEGGERQARSRVRKMTQQAQLKEIFQDVGSMAPRVGTVIVERDSGLFEKVKRLCGENGCEACGGVQGH